MKILVIFPNKLFTILFLLTLLCSVKASETNSNKVIRLAASTSIENSGLLNYLLPKFQNKYPYRLELKIVGSGKALRLARTGDVDMVWVHSPTTEKKFIDEGYGKIRHTVMANNFILVGPSNDPGDIASTNNIFEAFKRIAKQNLNFVSRADDSGTNKMELALWKTVGIDPYGSNWYLESGSGMAASLDLAQNENAYILIDRATFLVKKGSNHKVLLRDPTNLNNPYSVIAVNPIKHKSVNYDDANIFIRWLISPDGQNAISQYQHNGVQLFNAMDIFVENNP